MTALDICREAFFEFSIIVFILGACIGSFLNVVIWRLPRGGALSKPPSHCPKCRHAIRPWENIPMVSWLALRARCSSCKEPISIRYPAIELLTAVAFLCVWFTVLAQGDSPTRLLPLFFLVSALIATTFTDIETRTIPNKITFSGVLFGVLFVLFFPAAHPALSGPGGGGFIIPSHMLPDRLLPVADSAAGVLITLAVLWAIRVLTSVLFGRAHLQLENNTHLRITSDGVFAGQEKLFSWDEIVSGTLILNGLTGSSISGGLPDGHSPVVLYYRRGVLKSAGWTGDIDQIECLEGEGVSVTITRDAFGWGDIKLIAMIAALLGAVAIPFVLILSALPGMIIGGGLRFTSQTCRKQGVPFAPFLSLGTLIWIFFGDRLWALF